MKRVVTTVIVAVSIVPLAGCGSSGSSSSPQATADSFFHALASGDGAKACSYLTPHEQHVFTSNGGSVKLSSCPIAVDFFAKLLTKAQLQKIEHGVLAGARMTTNGNTATIKAKTGTRLTLTKTNGKWLISGGITS